MQPTEEQIICVERFKSGNDVAIEAGAGTGKTSTLVLLANAVKFRRGQYLAFNKAIVEDAASKMPLNVRANTMHSLAFKSIGYRYAARLQSRRMSSYDLARHLNTQSLEVFVDGQRRVLHFGYLASLAMASVMNFCRSADAAPGPTHVPYIEGIDLPDPEGKRTYRNNNFVREALTDAMTKAWKDLSDPNGQLRFQHDVYLKLWQLNEPRIAVDYVLFDESQDADPVQLSIVNRQQCQKVFVGDTQQTIYEWRGCVNALASTGISNPLFLTQSFRFGPPIADVANKILGWLNAPLRLRGLAAINSVVSPDINVDAILCRTNAAAIRNVLITRRSGRDVCLLGGATEILQFVRGVEELQRTGFTLHPELACFDSWVAVEEYVDRDPQGSELKLWVKLVNDFGTENILAALNSTVKEGPAVVVVSTAHKAKGRQWPNVRLADDFTPADPDRKTYELPASELRLRYVAATRAQFGLDCSAIPELRNEIDAHAKEAGY